MKALYAFAYLVSLFGGTYYTVQKDVYMEIFAFAFAIIFLLLSIEQRLIDHFKDN